MKPDAYCEYATMQYNDKTLYQMFKLSTSLPNSCPQLKLPLISHWISDCLWYA